MCKILKLIIRTQRKHKFVFLNSHPDIQANCIYALNHSCKWDSQYIMEIAPGSCTILAGKQRLKLIDRLVFILNGVVWVDRKDKSSKNASKEKMHAVLKKGKSLCVFPEGTWNLRPSLPVLPLYWGIVDVIYHQGSENSLVNEAAAANQTSSEETTKAASDDNEETTLEETTDQQDTDDETETETDK